MAQVAKRAGLDPLRALGIPHDLTLTPDVALLLHELLFPPKEGTKTEGELDEMAEKMAARMDLMESWERAVSTGYTGPRGTHRPPVRVLPWPEPAPCVPCAFPPAPLPTLSP